MRYLILALLVLGCSPASRPEMAFQEPTGIISITFDDALASFYDNGLPALGAHSIRGTIYVSTNNIDQAGYMTVSGLHHARLQGWEIGAHTMGHPNLAGLPDFMIHRELWGAKTQLEAWGFSPTTMATPFCSTSAVVQSIIPLYYESNRNCYQPREHFAGLDPYLTSGGSCQTSY
jgi:peptidoglycan/xylan/chitin deacetylase (PgdA/CDA1 family)